MVDNQDWLDVPKLVSELGEGDRQRVQQLWDRYFEKLMQLSNQKMPAQLRRICDGEDLALSALNSFIEGAEQRRFPDLQDPSDLWSLLVVISKRKMAYRIRSAKRLKRGGGLVRGESIFAAPDQAPHSEAVAGLEHFFGETPAVEDIVEIGERIELLLKKLGNDEFRQVVELKLQGHTHEEIAEVMAISVRTVHRRLLMVRQVWTEMAAEESAKAQPNQID